MNMPSVEFILMVGLSYLGPRGCTESPAVMLLGMTPWYVTLGARKERCFGRSLGVHWSHMRRVSFSSNRKPTLP